MIADGPAPPWLVLAGWYLAALLVATVLVRGCRTLARRYGYVARPREDRWHTQPTALFGGVGIAGASFGFALFGGDLAHIWLPLVCGGLMFGVGVFDDVIPLKPSTKLIAQIAVACVFVYFGPRLHWVEATAVDMLLTIVWLVGITNAFNLLDNMDGLCAGIVLIAGAVLLVGMFQQGAAPADMRYLAVLLGATTAFLLYNYHPASIFMGDGGSLFLGFTIAALSLGFAGQAEGRSNLLSIVGAPVLVVLIPIFDTLLVTFSRLRFGRRVSEGGRDHSSHRLVAIGLSERHAVGVLWVLAAAAGAISVAVHRFADDWAVLLATVFILAVVLFAVYLAQVRVYAEPSELPPGGVTPVAVQFMYKRRVAEVLLDVCLVTVAYYAAWRLRFEEALWSDYFDRFVESLPIVLAAQMVALFVFGAYRGAWRHYGLMEGVVFAKGVAGGVLTIIVAITYLYRFEHYSRGVFIIYAALLLLMLISSRASFRLMAEFVRRRRTGPRLVIYGAGEASSLLVREMLDDLDERYRMIGFIDDDPAKCGLRYQGYPVLGGQSELLQLVYAGGVDIVVIGSRRLDPRHLQAVEQACKAADVQLLRFHFRLEALVTSA
jgi:UDP-GlcNAc:undecaprenyl-phosphate/decaprenyl-phosphate GlcNAc-1-phosphate transferase